MDGLDNIANKAEAFEKSAQESSTFAPVDDKKESAGAIPAANELDAAANRAAIILKTLEAGVTAFVDQRLHFPEEEIAAGREGLAPILAKYNLAGDGDGQLPYQAEITAGLYLGGLWRRFRRALAHLRTLDKAEKQKQEQTSNGDQRKPEPQEQPRPVSSAVGVRQESDPETPRWLTGVGGTGSTMG